MADACSSGLGYDTIIVAASSIVAQPVAFDSPAVYRIGVEGRVLDSPPERLPPLDITVIPLEGGRAVSILVGEFRDQTALARFLDTLYEWQLALLSVERLSAAAPAREKR
jgi:hypothetical protein